jgi:hypothetical protein
LAFSSTERKKHEFLKLFFTLDGIWRHMGALFCIWELKWFNRL